ncbi:MAG: hypothetical protein K0M63_00295 [Weeksellaceae bacterium]|nr:hypothetical protein [Weeksellaceae bacterium]
MDNQDYNKAENALDKAKWTANDYADRAKDYIREQRNNNEEPTAEGWMERAKHNISDAWEDTKDAVSDAWEKTKDWTDDAWDDTKDAADDVADKTKDTWKDSTN